MACASFILKGKTKANCAAPQFSQMATGTIRKRKKAQKGTKRLTNASVSGHVVKSSRPKSGVIVSKKENRQRGAITKKKKTIWEWKFPVSKMVPKKES